MGRVMRHRHRVRAELSSVRTKDTRGLICRTLTSEFGANKIEAEVLSSRSLEWLGQMGVSALPGVVRLSVPEGSSKRYSRTRRKVVSVSAVDVGADSACWEAFGLEVAQRMRLVRWIEQIARQGACASLAELASWANLTPTAAQARLSPLRRLGIYLPHVGGPEDSDDALSTEALLVDRYLTNGATEDLRHLLGVTAPAFEATLRRFITVTEGQAVGLSIEELARTCDRSEAEIAKLASVAHRHRRSAALESSAPPTEASSAPRPIRPRRRPSVPSSSAASASRRSRPRYLTTGSASLQGRSTRAGPTTASSSSSPSRPTKEPGHGSPRRPRSRSV